MAAWKRLVTWFRPRTGALAGLVALAAALLLSPTPAPARTTAALYSALSESAAPEQGRRRRAARPERRREQPAEPAPARTTPAPAQPRPAPPPGLCDVDWHQSNRGSSAVTRAVAGGADVNQACGSGSSPLLLALEYGSADVVLALIRAGANLDYRDPYTPRTPNQVINDRCDAGSIARRVCAEVRRGFEARAEAHNCLGLPGRDEKIHETVCRYGDHVPIRGVWRARTMTGAVRRGPGLSGTPGTCASNTSNEKTRR